MKQPKPRIPKYNPLAMGSLQVANNYAIKLNRYLDWRNSRDLNNKNNG